MALRAGDRGIAGDRASAESEVGTMKRMVLVAAGAALLVGAACAPVKPPSGIPGRDVYVTEVYVLTSSSSSLTVEVTCELSYIHGNETPAVGSPQVAEVPHNSLFTYDWRDQDITECTAREISGKNVLYGKPSVHGASTTELYPTPQECYYDPGGQGNIQTCYFYIQEV